MNLAKIIFIFCLVMFFVGGCCELEQNQGNVEKFREVSSSYKTPYGVSIISIEGRDYIVVRTSDGVAICPKQ